MPAPANGNTTQEAGLDDVSCQSSGVCTAVGYYYYDATGPHYAGMVVQVTGGVPGPAIEDTALPANSSGDDWYLDHVACPPAGTCSAVGYYNGGDFDLVVPINGGVPGQGVEAPTPSGAIGTSSSLDGITCQATGACVAVGQYTGPSSETLAVAVPITNGVPAATVEVLAPADAEGVGQDTELPDVSCPASGSCLATGYFINSTGNYVGMTVSFNGGTVGTAITAPAPSDEITGGHASAQPETVGCAATSCAVTGYYANAGDDDAPYVVSAQAPLTVGTTGLPAGEIGSAYSQTVSATGAWGISGWTLASGTLPAGLTLNSVTGVISGTPTTPGSSTFTVEATGLGTPVQTATQSLSVTVAKAGLKVVGSSAKVKKNRFGMKLSCSDGSCTGTATLQITERYVVKHGKKKLHKHRTVEIGSVHFSLAVGKTQTYTLTLSAAGRKYLKTHTRLASTVTATVDGVKETAGHLTLTAAPAKKKKKH